MMADCYLSPNRVSKQEISTLAKLGKYGISFLLVAGTIQLPRYLINILNLPVPQFGMNFPLTGPFVLSVLLGATFAVTDRKSILLRFRIQDVLMAIGLLFGLIMEFSYFFDLSDVNVDLLIPFFWYVVFYITLRQFGEMQSDVNWLLSMLLFSMTVLVLIHLGLNVWLDFSPESFPKKIIVSEIIDRNSVAAQSVIAVWLLLFHPVVRRRWHRVLLISALLVHLANPIVNHSKGAILGLCFLFVFWLIGLFGIKKCFISLCLIVIVLAIAMIFFPNMKEKIDRQFFVIDIGRKIPLEEARELSNSTISTNSRIRSIFLTYQLFVDSPITGVGGAAVSKVRVSGYPCHSYAVMIIAAYGASIVMFMVFGVGIALWEGFRMGALLTITGAILSILFLFLNNSLYPWMAVILFSLSADGVFEKESS